MKTCKLKTAKPEDQPVEFVQHGAMSVKVFAPDKTNYVVIGPKEFSEKYDIVPDTKG